MTGLLERDILVISQRAKLIEMTNEYRILDPEGEEVGAIHENGLVEIQEAAPVRQRRRSVPDAPPFRLRGRRLEAA